MKDTSHHDEAFAKMTFASVYPHYVTKVEKKGKSKEELHKVIKWLTGYTDKRLEKLIEDEVTFEGFFKKSQTKSKRKFDHGCDLRIPGGRNRKSTYPAGEISG